MPEWRPRLFAMLGPTPAGPDPNQPLALQPAPQPAPPQTQRPIPVKLDKARIRNHHHRIECSSPQDQPSMGYFRRRPKPNPGPRLPQPQLHQIPSNLPWKTPTLTQQMWTTVGQLLGNCCPGWRQTWWLHQPVQHLQHKQPSSLQKLLQLGGHMLLLLGIPIDSVNGLIPQNDYSASQPFANEQSKEIKHQKIIFHPIEQNVTDVTFLRDPGSLQTPDPASQSDGWFHPPT